MADGGADPAAGAGARVRYAPEVGAEICERVAGGESLLSICRDAAMPNASTVRDWMERHAGFGAALRAAQRQGRVAARRADLARFAGARDNRGRWSTYTEEMGEEICRRLVEGETLIAIAADPAMPCYSTVLNWARRIPAFADAYAEARGLAADWLADEAREVALATSPEWVWADRLRFDTVRWLTARLAPKKYVERVVVARLAAADKQAAAAPAETPRTFITVAFKQGPDGRVLVAPPRTPEEDQAWIDSTGKPYDGPRARVGPGAPKYTRSLGGVFVEG